MSQAPAAEAGGGKMSHLPCSSHMLPLLPLRGPDRLDFLHSDASFLEKGNGLAHHQIRFLLLARVLVSPRPLGWHRRWHRRWHRYFAPLPCILVTGNWFCFHAHSLPSYPAGPLKGILVSFSLCLCLSVSLSSLPHIPG